MAIIDPCLIFSTLFWFLVSFVYFYSFFVGNPQLLAIVKNIKFRNKKLNSDFLFLQQFKSLGFSQILLIIYFVFKLQSNNRLNRLNRLTKNKYKYYE